MATWIKEWKQVIVLLICFSLLALAVMVFVFLEAVNQEHSKEQQGYTISQEDVTCQENNCK